MPALPSSNQLSATVPEHWQKQLWHNLRRSFKTLHLLVVLVPHILPLLMHSQTWEMSLRAKKRLPVLPVQAGKFLLFAPLRLNKLLTLAALHLQLLVQQLITLESLVSLLRIQSSQLPPPKLPLQLLPLLPDLLPPHGSLELQRRLGVVKHGLNSWLMKELFRFA
jgi:hypothetical protein